MMLPENEIIDKVIFVNEIKNCILKSIASSLQKFLDIVLSFTRELMQFPKYILLKNNEFFKESIYFWVFLRSI